MASTIKLKNGSGAPLASDLVAGEPALDLTNKRLYTEDSGGAVIEVGTNPTELQVDNINIDGNAITSTDTDGNIAITPNGTGEVDISKVDIDSGAIDGTVIGGTTTAAGSFTTLQADTSLNVDGTVTADGLTVDSSSSVISTFNGTAATGINVSIKNTEHEFYIGTNDGNLYLYDVDNTATRFNIASNGDISFYEDTGATAKFFWDASAERLGIGYTASSPNGILDLSIQNNNVYDPASYPTELIGLRNLSNTAGTDVSLYMNVSGNGASSAAGAMSLVHTGDGSGALTFQTRNSGTMAERVRISSAGNVGIGVDPSEKLEVYGTTPRFQINDRGLYQAQLALIGNDLEIRGSSGKIEFYQGNADGASSTNQAMTLDASGNLGIGTTTVEDSTGSSTRLQIQETNAGGDVALRIKNNSTTSGSTSSIRFTNTTTTFDHGGIVAGRTPSSYLAFEVSDGSEAMRIDSSGNLQVGTQSFSSAGTDTGVGIYGQYGQLLTNMHGNEYHIFNIHTSGTQNRYVQFRWGDVTVGSISTNGSTTTYATSSDYRLKENVVDMTGAIDRVKALNPSQFNFIADPDTTVDGFLAHEVSDVVPEAVTGTKDAMRTEEYEVTPAVLDEEGNVVTEAVMGTREVPDYQGIDQSKLVPLLTGALQEAIARIETLEAQVATLQGN